MKVILKEYVYKHGVAGDVVQVADGFARNYLIPRGLAVKATAGALREHQHLLKNAAIRRDELHQREQEAANRINGVELVFGVKAGKNGKLYGSITTMDIAQALEEKTGVDINRRRISERPLRELGVHTVPVRLGGGISPELRVVVIREEEVADYEAGRPVASLRGLGGRFEAAEEAVDDTASAEPVDVADDTAAASELEDEEAQAAE
ncbi:MAG: 50S ribosomal protein L9 [Chloroflexota bacterium]|jgi:large subunit ribosomal protein L9|nr:50S ribosomal protein L9 [Anaerolineae bacterium]HMM29139.1 50S ribosomal protein L9 [Aggregatilineaceae bacterium]